VTIDPDAPWQVNALLVVLVLVAVPVLGWLLNRPLNRKVERVAADARTAAEQTANTHSLNLRDDLDEKDARTTRAISVLSDALQAIREDVGGLHSEIRDARQDIAGVRTDARADRRAVTQVRADLNGFVRGREHALDELRDALDELRDSIPAVVAHAVTQHVHDYPPSPHTKEPPP